LLAPGRELAMAESEGGNPLTQGVHHIGLSVADLDASVDFFVACLGWRKVGGVPDYPSAFVSDGKIVLTLWQVKDRKASAPFDRRKNVGLHHLALAVESKGALEALIAKVSKWPGISVEFQPAPFAGGAMFHAMVYEPGGTRLEFAAPAA
jgi:catechol 2,3-dioxygenase-like lactoylglutathione lyase family enzyme